MDIARVSFFFFLFFCWVAGIRAARIG